MLVADPGQEMTVYPGVDGTGGAKVPGTAARDRQPQLHHGVSQQDSDCNIDLGSEPCVPHQHGGKKPGEGDTPQDAGIAYLIQAAGMPVPQP